LDGVEETALKNHKAIIDKTGHRVQFIFNGRWVEVELPYSIYDMAELAMGQMKPKEPGDGVRKAGGKDEQANSN
jgi:hypothetical protein